MRYDQLPANLRAQVDAKLGTEGKRKRTTRHQAAVNASPCSCHACGAVFPRYELWEAHSDESGHARCNLTLGEP